MKIRAFILTFLGVACAFGQLQQTAPADRPAGGVFNPVSLATEFFDRGNFVNYYAFANAVYDSYNPQLDSSSGQTTNRGGLGYSVGGGISAYHVWHRSSLALSYTGSYSDYSNSFFLNGTNQALNLSYNQRLSRRWNFNTGVLAGNTLYGSGYFNVQGTTANDIQLNPFSANTRYLSGYVSLAYQQNRRLSYVFSGNLYLQRFSYSGAVGTTGGSGGVSVAYRVTPRTTVSGNYNHSYFHYQLGAGDTSIDGFFFSASHTFRNLWIISANGGVTRATVNSTLNLPVGFISPTAITTGFIRVPYTSTSLLPAFGGAATRNWRRSQFTVSGGQSVVSGNGYYLASRSQYLSGFYSRSYRRANAGVGGYWSRLNSVANSINYSYNTSGLSANYGYVVFPHVSTNFRYDFVRYGVINTYNAVSDNRLTIGVSFSSKSIPLTLY